MNENTKIKSLSTQEWTHHIFSEDVGKKPLHVSISLPEENISSLCKRLDLHSIESLSADIVLTRNPVSKVIHVKGRLYADIHQYCVVTMEAVSGRVEDIFESWCAEPNNAVSFTKAKRERMGDQERSEQPMLEEYDDPEEIIDGKIDLGELVTQHLSLSLNPYPRKKGTTYNNQDRSLEDNKGNELYDNPFAALKEWKSSEKKKD